MIQWSSMEIHNVDFALQIDFLKKSERPSRIFQATHDLIETFQVIDKALIGAIDNKIEPVLLLEDIEAGSLRTWFSNFLRAIPDDALYNLDWKPLVGQYLVKAKFLMINFLEGKVQITNIDDLQPLIKQVDIAARETKVRWIDDYQLIQPRPLLQGIQRISENTKLLLPGDKASYITSTDKADFNLEFNMSPDSLDELLESQRIVNETEQIVKVKKPDYLGESQWELRQENKNYFAIISDKEWLSNFQARRVQIQPGDALRVILKETHHYDYTGEVIKTSHEVVKVIEVVSGGEEQTLFD
jgi:hypothetical protein